MMDGISPNAYRTTGPQSGLEVSLMTLILEQDNGDSVTLTRANVYSGDGAASFSVSSCADKLVEAVDALMSAGERQSLALRDEVFTKQMTEACEVLTLASDNLFIQAHRYEMKHSSGTVKHQLCQAAKDVLQAVLKVLLVSDDFYVRQLLGKTDSVLSLIRTVETAKDKSELISLFKSIMYAVLAFKVELVKRCQNLRSKSCRDEILIWASVLQNSIPSLSKSSQTYLKYRSSSSAKASRDTVLQEIDEACGKIKHLLQYGLDDGDDDRIASFVFTVDKVVENLSVKNRGALDPDIESHIIFLIRHSMSVAHYASGVYTELISATCHRVLQAMFRLLELDAALRERPGLLEMRSEYDNICEAMLDEVIDLEKHVSLTLVHLIVETFLCPLSHLTQLKESAGHRSKSSQCQENIVMRFSDYTELVCQVASLVAASSTDTARVREIVTSVRCLESLEPDFAPALVSLQKGPQNRGARKHFELLMDRWAQEMQTVVDAVDSLIDPEVFMDVCETLLTKEVELFRSMYGCSHDDVRKHFSRFLQLSERPGILARKLLDENCDPVYRNGFNYFIKLLFQRMSEAEKVYLEIVQTTDPPIRQYDTLERRMSLVVHALRNLREGFNAKNHPSLLSAKRMISKQRGQVTLHPKLVKKDSQGREKTTAKSELVDSEVSNKEADIGHMDEKKKQSKDRGNTSNSQAREAEVVIEKSTSAPEVKMGVPPPDPPGEAAKNEAQVSCTPTLGLFEEEEYKAGPARQVYQVAKLFLEACTRQDHKLIEAITHDLLGWSNHITENAEKLQFHCSHIPKERELQDLTSRLGHVTKEVVQTATFIKAGGEQDICGLQQSVLEWTKSVNSLRIIVDVTVDRWLALTSSLQPVLEEHNEYQLKILMMTIGRAQKDLCELLQKGQSFSGKCIENGTQKIEYLAEVCHEVENLTLTIQTSVDGTMVSARKSEDTWWQLARTCREWSVAMSCALSELENLCHKMELVGRERFRGLQALVNKRVSQVPGVVEEETDCLVELVDCVVVRDMKSRSDEMVTELHAALSNFLAIAKLPAASVRTSLDDLFSSLGLHLAVSKWVEKAVVVQDLIRNNCYEYYGFAHQHLVHIRDVLSDENLQDGEKKKERNEHACIFLEKSQQLKQLILRAIQLSPDLPRRMVIRSTLDMLSKLTSQIEGLLRASLRLTDADVNCLSLNWGARMKKLMLNLHGMEGVKASVLSEIERFNKGISVLLAHPTSWPHRAQQPKSTPYRQQQQQQNQQQQQQLQAQPHYHQKQLQAQPHYHQKQLQAQPYYQQHQQQNHQQQQQHHEHIPVPASSQWGQQLQLEFPSMTDPIQHFPETRDRLNPQVPNSGRGAGGLLVSLTTAHARNEPSQVIKSPHTEDILETVLSDSKYLNSRLKMWQDIRGHPEATAQRSKVISSAQDMASLCREIALSTKGQGILKNSEEVIGAALAIVSHTSLLEDFGRKLWNLAGHGKCADNLETCITKLGTCASQLHIISSTLHNSAKSCQGDRILMRNTLNLLMAVRQMFSLAETLASQTHGQEGVEEITSSDDEMSRDVLSLLQTIKSDNEQYIKRERRTTKLDDLGLRRVEHHSPPSLTSMFDVCLVRP